MRLTEDDIRALEPVLRVVAQRSVQDKAAAQDLVQETLLAAIAGLRTFDGRSELRTWVVAILANKTVDHFRRAKRWQAVDLDTTSDPRLLEPGARTPETDLSDRQSLDILEQALKGLSENERMAVVLTDVEGLPREEVCNVLGVRATHLRVLLHRARHQLRKALEDADV